MGSTYDLFIKEKIKKANSSRGFISIDCFAGGGGASYAIERATGFSPVFAINHDEKALRMHEVNHQDTYHLCDDIWSVEPSLFKDLDVDLAWFSPDCTHFSRAKGGKPRKKEIRGLAWVVVTDPRNPEARDGWANVVRPSVIFLENVEEFQGWGPLYPEDHTVEKLRNRPIPERKGETFKIWVKALEDLGYDVEWRVLRACDYGAPTTRLRLFLVARCDGEPICWPEPTHGPSDQLGLFKRKPYKPVSDCINWTIPCPSIFTRKRPLAEKTQARIAEGIRRYVLNAEKPYIVQLNNGLIAAGSNQLMNTITAQGSQGTLVAAFLAKHYSGVIGHGVDRPLGTVTSKDHHSLVTAHITKYYGTSIGGGIDEPAPTIIGQGQHLGLVAAFLIKYYSQGGQWSSLNDPLHTIVQKDRMGLVILKIQGEDYVIVDIGMRMLQPKELARAQGFPDSYQLIGTKTKQVALIGNSVSPPPARALIEAQFNQKEAKKRA